MRGGKYNGAGRDRQVERSPRALQDLGAEFDRLLSLFPDQAEHIRAARAQMFLNHRRWPMIANLTSVPSASGP
eukprot:9498570-Pyramimonas_sp.AAC.1